MGIYIRRDSPYFWMWLEHYRDARGRSLRERTSIRHDAPTPELRKKNRELAQMVYHERMVELAKINPLSLNKPDRTFDEQAAWFRAHLLPRRDRQVQESAKLAELVEVFGDDQLKMLTRNRIIDRWIRPRTDSVTRTGKQYIEHPRLLARELRLLEAVLESAVPKYLNAAALYDIRHLWDQDFVVVARRRSLK